jgi:hypothetical protein
VGLPVDVPGHVLGRPAELEQGLLETSTLRWMDSDKIIGNAGAEHARELLGARDLDQHRLVEAAQHEAVRGVVGQLEPPVAVHRLGDVDQKRVRHRGSG